MCNLKPTMDTVTMHSALSKLNFDEWIPVMERINYHLFSHTFGAMFFGSHLFRPIFSQFHFSNKISSFSTSYLSFSKENISHLYYSRENIISFIKNLSIKILFIKNLCMKNYPPIMETLKVNTQFIT